MKDVERKIRDYIDSARREGKKPIDAYEELLKGLKEQREIRYPGSEHKLFDVLKEIVLLKPEEKLKILRKIRNQIEKKSDLFVLPDALRELLFNMIEELINDSNVKVLNPFSGTGSLLDYIALHHQDAKIVSQEINDREKNMQGMIFEVCDLQNVDVKKDDSLSYTPEEQYDLIISNPPVNARISQDKVKLNDFSKSDYGRLNAEQAFILKSLESIKDEGIIVGVFSPGFLFNTKNQDIRDLILEQTQVLSIIETPRNVYSATSINMAIVIMKKKSRTEESKQPKDVLMASFKDMKIGSDEFDEESKNLLQEWKAFVREEL